MNLRLLVSYDFVEFFHFYLSISLRDARSKIDGRETPRARGDGGNERKGFSGTVFNFNGYG